MARMTIRATYALDEQTDAHVRELARRWGVSQAEVIRRSVQQAAAAEQPRPPTPAEVVRHYRRGSLPRTRAAAKDWAGKNRAARQAADCARTQPTRP